MPYLISDISDDTELLPVNASISNPTYPLFYDLASETVKVLAGANTTEWQVARGVGNTQAVRHSRGTPLVLNSSPFGGGGSVTVTTLAGPAVDNVDTIQVPNVVNAGGGLVVLATLVIADSDPGAIGPGNFWLNNDVAPGGTPDIVQLMVRNATNNGWYAVTAPTLASADGSDWTLLTNAERAIVQNQSTFLRIQQQDNAVNLDVGDTYIDLHASNTHDIYVDDSNGIFMTGPIGFYGTPPVAQPAAPTTLQNVIDALKALGLVAS